MTMVDYTQKLNPCVAAPIRMLFITREEFPTYRVDIEVLFGQELIGRGNRIDLVMQAQSSARPAGVQSWHGGRVFVGPTHAGDGLNRIAKQWLGFWHDLRLLLSASRSRYDAIQVRDKFVIAALSVVIVRLRRLKLFFWLSFPYPEDDILRARAGTSRNDTVVYVRGLLCRWLLYRWILPRCDHTFVQSQQMRKDVCAHGIDPAKVTPVPMGISAADIVAPREPVRDTYQSDGMVLAYLGTLNAQRRLEVLIEMLALLRFHGVAAKLLLVGDGDLPGDRARLERRADELQVRQFLEITGFLPRAEALKRMYQADAGISPFFPIPVLRSTSPTKLIEYMALGLPVIANDHPEQSLILRESRAGVCVPWGSRHFARAVRWLVRIGGAKRAVMGEKGRVWVQSNRTYSKIADDVETTYQKLLGSRCTPKVE